MKMNFNVGGDINKKLTTEEAEDLEEIVENENTVEELEEFDDDYDTTPTFNKDNDPTKKLIKMMLIGVGVIAIIIVLLLIITSATSGNKSYEDIEEIMVNAAESYFSENKDKLPSKDGGSQTIDVSVLVAEGKMKDLSKYTSDTSCNGSVKVEKSGSTYLYIPNLTCGDSYSSKELYEQVRSDNSIVTSGYGLYNKDGSYVFRGEIVNNYVQLDNSLWRIVKITSGNNIELILADTIGTSEPWDDRYNQEKGYNTGYNTFANSRIKDSLNELYTTTDEDIIEKFLSNSDKGKIVSYNICTGKRGPKEAGVEQAIECKEVLKNQKVGLLTAADYMNASLDAGCTTPSSKNCQNYNYLATGSKWWLQTASSTNSYFTYLVNENGNIEEGNASRYARLRPVIYLNTNVLYKSGNGTEEDPYILK